ncbi:MAG: bis(5'-nucleosyl)-tetraphosphatase (symmetrical) YqeK [Mobilitalea sp.]
MDLELMKDSLKMLLKESRYLHSVGAMEVSCDLAFIHGYDAEKASIAGILHDCARNLSDEELLKECEKYHLPVSALENRWGFLLHGKVGAVYAKDKFGVEDEDILNAIIYHTTGRPAMTLIEKILFIADYIEPYRKPLPRIDEIRKTAYTDLNLAAFMILENILEYLKCAGTEIDSLTIETYEYYKTILQIFY